MTCVAVREFSHSPLLMHNVIMHEHVAGVHPLFCTATTDYHNQSSFVASKVVG